MFDDEDAYEELFNGQVYKIPSRKIQDEAEEEECLVNNIVNNFRYTQTEMTKKDFLAYFKALAKQLLDKLTAEGCSEEEIANFKKESGNFAKFVVENFDDCEFYLSENGVSYDAATMGIGYWGPSCTDGPDFYYLKHSLKEVKI
jgi:hypothetical protein